VRRSPPSCFTITLDAVPVFANENGVDYLTVADQDEITGVVASGTGHAPTDFTYQMPDDAVAPTNVVFETRWR
jgi:hypothetical protein